MQDKFVRVIKQTRQVEWKENVTGVCKLANISTVFPRYTFSLNNTAFSSLHIVWQTHGFVVKKMAFQHVIINNSLMTNSFDIYTALSVCLTLTGRQ